MGFRQKGENIPKKVAFGNIEVREYKTTIGDNPHCSSGIAISLDWEYEEMKNIPSKVDVYEQINRASETLEKARLERLQTLHEINRHRHGNKQGIEAIFKAVTMLLSCIFEKENNKYERSFPSDHPEFHVDLPKSAYCNNNIVKAT